MGIKLPTKEYVDKKILNLGYNTKGDNIYIKFNLPDKDKGTAVAFGSHNGNNFLSLIYLHKSNSGIGVVNVHGTLSISSKKVTDVIIELDFSTNMYGNFSIISDTEILEAYYH